MKSYKFTIQFTASRELTEDELGLLYSQVMAQIEEPTDEEGDNATYEIYSIAHSSLKEDK